MEQTRTLSDWITSFLEYTENTEPPESFKTWVAIGTIAACLQRKCCFMWHQLIYPNMYIILVGPAGKALKTTSMSEGISMLEEIGVEIAPEATTREALIRRIRNSLKQESDGFNIEFHSSLTIFNSEITVFIGYRNQQLISDLCAWYDCTTPWRYDTKDKTKQDYIDNLWVNMIGGTAPETLQAALPAEAIGGGLTSRIIFIYERDKGKVVYVPSTINTKLFKDKYNLKVPEKIKALRENLLNDLRQILMMKGEFIPTEDFVDNWIKFKAHHEKNPLFMNTPMASYNGRRQTHILKLSMIVSASRSNDMIITGEDLNRAISLLENVEKNMLYVFAGVGKSDIAAVTSKVIGILAAQNEITMGKLMEILYYDVDIEGLKKVIATLRAMGHAQYIPSETRDIKDAIVRFIRKEDKDVDSV